MLPCNADEFKNYCRKVTAFAAMFSLVVTPSISFSVPFGGIVSDGSASIQNVANGVVVNQGSDKAIIDWQGFDVNANEKAQFNVPNGNSFTLNRIHDAKPSQIYGQVSSNGQLMLINRNGMVFGKGSKVDANGFLATTSDISNSDFMNGKNNFRSGGNADASIENQGTITIRNGGSAALVAPNVKNSGTIEANFGKVSLAAGDTFAIDPYGDGLIQLAVPEHMTKATVENTGTIRARGGKVQLEASLDDVTDSLINLDGAVDVSNAYGVGGDITATASNIQVKEAQIDASGITGGGRVHIGGGYQGGGSQKHAENVTIGSKAVIKADAAVSGKGGEVIAWSDGRTDFEGTVTAKGGAKSGDGGMIETSGRSLNITGGKADASAPKGNAGTWLLDPNNITIQTAGGDTNVTATPNFSSTNDNAIVTTGSIETALNGGTSVVVQTTSSGANTQEGDITVLNNIAKTAGGDATLTLKAFREIVISGAQITSTFGKLNIVLNSGSSANNTAGGIYLTAGSVLNSNGGDITLGGGLDPLNNYATGTQLFAHHHGVSIDSSTLNALGGNISIRGASSGDNGANANGVRLNNSSAIQTNGTGTVNIVGFLNDGQQGGAGLVSYGSDIQTTAGGITITGLVGATTFSSPTALDIEGGNILSTSGNISLSGTGGTGPAGQHGMYLSGTWGAGTDLLIQTQNGNIRIEGTGGSSSTNSSYGIWMDGGTNIQSTGTGNVDIIGTASFVAPTSETGIYIQDGYFTGGATARIRTHDGNLSITGTATGTDPFDAGINLGGGAVIDSNGLGSITMTGNGLGSTKGISFNNYNGNVGTNFIGSGATQGTINLRANNVDVTTINGIQTTGTVSIAPVTASTTIGVAGGAGALGIDATLLGAINAGTVSIGSASGSGAINLGAKVWNSNAEILSGTGQINVNGAQTAGAHTFNARSGNADIVLNNSISSSAAGDNIVLATNNALTNNVGAAALNSTVGRWLIYAASGNLNGLVPDFVQYSSTYGSNPPGSVAATGNGLLRTMAQPPAGGNNGAGSSAPSPVVTPPVETPVTPTIPATPVPVGGNNGAGQPVPVVSVPELDISLDNYLRNNPVIKVGENITPDNPKPTQQMVATNQKCMGSGFDFSCSTHIANDLWMQKPLADLLEIDAKWLKLKYGINVTIQ